MSRAQVENRQVISQMIMGRASEASETTLLWRNFIIIKSYILGVKMRKISCKDKIGHTRGKNEENFLLLARPGVRPPSVYGEDAPTSI